MENPKSGYMISSTLLIDLKTIYFFFLFYYMYLQKLSKFKNLIV